jgi:hypothetical protein
MKQSPNNEYKDSLGIWMIHIVEESNYCCCIILYIYIYINWLMYVVGVIEDWDN